MAQYIKWPCCELNYINPAEKHCKVCDPKMCGKLISDNEADYEEKRETKLKAYQAKKESMEAFYSIRWNRCPKR